LWREKRDQDVVEGKFGTIAQVPYSLHCSFGELHDFVAALRPRSLVCTVSARIEPEVSNDACAHFAHLLLPQGPAGAGAPLAPPPWEPRMCALICCSVPMHLSAVAAMLELDVGE
jgi:hypothetical protein